MFFCFFFFFQAEDGIRDRDVTGVQTCALPICPVAVRVEPYPAKVPWTRGRVVSWLTTTDHKRIGILYISTSLLFFLLGGLLALLMRAQLATPNESFVTKNSYDELFTMHGTTMVFLVVVPILAGFGNFLV